MVLVHMQGDLLICGFKVNRVIIHPSFFVMIICVCLEKWCHGYIHDIYTVKKNMIQLETTCLGDTGKVCKYVYIYIYIYMHMHAWTFIVPYQGVVSSYCHDLPMTQPSRTII